MKRSLSAILPSVPIVGAAALIIAINLHALVVRLLLPYPVSSWEAGIITDAWRISQGQAIYSAGLEHATQMYGPFTTLLLSELFRISGPVLAAGRLLNALSALAVMGLLTTLYGRASIAVWVISAGLLLAANSRTNFYFTETRPDMISILFVCLSLISFYLGLETTNVVRRLAFTLAGSALLVTAMMFKQTAVAFAFLPLLVSFTKRSPNKDLPYAIIPLVIVAVVAGSIYFLNGMLWFFMVEEPAQYGVPATRVLRMGLEFCASVPVFLIALLHWLCTDAREDWNSRRVTWLVVATCVAVPASIVAEAKDGGNANSLIPALLCGAAFCIWRLPQALALLRCKTRPLGVRCCVGTVLGLLLFLHAYPTLGVISPSGLRMGHGVADRTSIIAEARSLPGKVASPDDPTIALMAKGFAGRTAVFEADAVKWNPNRTQNLVRDIESSDYVIVMHHGLQPDGRAMVSETSSGNLEWWPKSQLLSELGFKETRFESTSTPVYSLWRRERIH